MNTTQTASQKLATFTAAQATVTLVEAFGHTEEILGSGISPTEAAPVYVSRGAIMDELERRDAAAFAAWIEGPADIAALRAAFAA